MTCDRSRGARVIGVRLRRAAPGAWARPNVAAEPARTLVLNVHGPLRRSDLPGLFARTCGLLGEHEPDLVVCEVARVDADAVAVDALARLGLAARQAGCELRLRRPVPALCELLDLCGLADVLRVEARREPEQREQPLRVEEGVEMGDPPVL